MPQDYNSTLNLPKTDFPMRAGLPKSEPVTLKRWEDSQVYETLMKNNEGKPLYVLHDGPPYANGNIHLGHAMNKVLKDIIVRYKNMTGFKAPYVPGWDTHGLPTELKARAKAGVGNSTSMSVVELRKICRDFALGYIDDQRTQFKRLGAIGEWNNPYITLTHDYEAKQIRIFSEMAMKGYIYRGLKPVYWCPDCETALAEAEIEYAEDPCHSIYVKFRVTDDLGKLSAMGADVKNTYFVIWTTTTWTLPANVAICVGPRFNYSVIKSGNEYYVMAEELYVSAMEAAGIDNYEVIGTIKGAELEYMKTAHPFIDRTSLVIVGNHVTLESGTGCVHTAPGHGVDDYEVCRNYKELPMVVPVDAHGRLTEEAGMFAGLLTEDANKPIAEYLEKTGALFALKKIIHQYPHCWRCKKPVLFRATKQWFCSVDDFKDEAIEAIKGIQWIPGWGEDRITSMVRERKDWCISRQRKWGVPIPIFFCKDCGEPIIDKKAMDAVADLFAKEGSDAWYAKDVRTAYFTGLVNGKTATSFEPAANITYAETVKLAACMQQLYTSGEVTLTNGSPNWYDSYAAYARENGIINRDYDWNAQATRAEFVEIFAHALPEGAYHQINDVPDDGIPDVKAAHPQAESVYLFYRAGILNGYPTEGASFGEFRPNDTITRAEVAAILTRMMYEEYRVSV